MSNESSNTVQIDEADLAELLDLGGTVSVSEKPSATNPLVRVTNDVDTSLDEEIEGGSGGGETDEQKAAREAAETSKAAAIEAAKKKAEELAAAGGNPPAGTQGTELDLDIIEDEGSKAPAAKTAGQSLAFLDHLVKKEEIFLFEGDKPLSEYTNKEKADLIRANMARIKEEAEENAPVEFYKSLPEPMQYAAAYIANGGKNLTALFKSLGEVSEIADLDIKTPEGQEQAVRQWLHATEAGTPEQIEEELSALKDMPGALEKRATMVKPKLEAKKQENVERQVRDAEAAAKQREANAVAYRESIIQTLQKPDLNGLKLKPAEKNFLFNEMTQLKHQLKTGQQTNILGALLEKYQRLEPNPALIMKAVLLLNDEVRFMEMVKESNNTAIVTKVVADLKTASSKDKGSYTPAPGKGPEKQGQQKTIKKANIFSW